MLQLIAASSGLIDGVIAGLAVALVTALIGMGGVFLRLKTLGGAERGKLEAEREDIIRTAENRATARALDALKMALDVTERERDRAFNQLGSARTEMDAMRVRLSALEALVIKNENRRVEAERAKVVSDDNAESVVSQLEVMRQDLASAHTRIAELEKCRVVQQEEINALRVENAELRARLETA